MWRIYLHDWAGTRLGEITDASNIKLETGINKNPTLSFDTDLGTPMADMIGEITAADPYTSATPTATLLADREFSIITAYRYNPYTSTWQLMFSGPVFSTEEQSSDNNATIGVTAIGSHWRLTKTVADNADAKGRTQSGLDPLETQIQLAVADTSANRVIVYDAETGSHIRTITSSFNGPRDVAFGDNNSIYVCDTGNHQIKKFSNTGTLLFTKGSTAGSGNTQFNGPRGICVDASGNFWVADRGNKRVVKYDKNGNYLLKVSATVTYPMAYLEHISYGADDGYIYAASNGENIAYYQITSNGTIRFATLGNLLKIIKKKNSPATETGYLNCTSAGELYNWLGGSNKIGTETTNQSMAIGPDKSIYAIQMSGSTAGYPRVYKYNSSGVKTQTIGQYAAGTATTIGGTLAAGATRAAYGIDVARVGESPITFIETILNYVNSTSSTNTWVRPATSNGTTDSIFTNPGTLGGYKSIAEIIEQLGASYEWKMIPKIETDANGLVLGHWYANSILGSDKSLLVSFEYGDGLTNVETYSIKKSIEGLANKASYPAADSKNYSITASDGTSINLIGTFEDIVNGSIVDDTYRQKFLDFYLQIKKYPRILVEITPSRSDQTNTTNRKTPIPLIDYDVGDTVGVTITENGKERIPTGKVRVYDITINVDEVGRETAELGLYLS